jgi:hypothetical protein
LNVANCENSSKEIDEKLSDFFEKEKRIMGIWQLQELKILKIRINSSQKFKKKKYRKLNFMLIVIISKIYLKKKSRFMTT